MAAFRLSLNSTSLNRSSSTAATFTHTHSHTTVTSAPSLSKVNSYPDQLLDTLVTKHFRATQSAPLSLAGTHLPLIYKLVATLITVPQSKAVVVIDIDAKFDITRVLQCAPFPVTDQTAPDHGPPGPPNNDMSAQQRQQKPIMFAFDSHGVTVSATHQHRVAVEDLKHVHVYRPAPGSQSHIRDVIASAEHFIIYSRHASVAREWWGTINIGGSGPAAPGYRHADVVTGWKGWLRVDREEVRGFTLGMSAEEALADRDQRQRAADASGHLASCAWGGFTFKEASSE